MKNNQLLKNGEKLIRVLDIKDGQAFIVDCRNKTMPKWVNADSLADYTICSDDVLAPLPDINDLDLQSRKFAYEHFTYIAGVLPFVTDKKRRCKAIAERGIYSQMLTTFAFHFECGLDFLCGVPCVKFVTKIAYRRHIKLGLYG